MEPSMKSVIDDELGVAQAKLRLQRARADALILLAERARSDGRDSPALHQLAALGRGASLADAGPLFVRALEELGVPPMSDDDARERLLWVPARRIAAAIVDHTLEPLAGARAIQWLTDDFGCPEEMLDFSSDKESVVIAAAERLLQR
jgi:hypothetical protein